MKCVRRGILCHHGLEQECDTERGLHSGPFTRGALSVDVRTRSRCPRSIHFLPTENTRWPHFSAIVLRKYVACPSFLVPIRTIGIPRCSTLCGRLSVSFSFRKENASSVLTAVFPLKLVTFGLMNCSQKLQFTQLPLSNHGSIVTLSARAGTVVFLMSERFQQRRFQPLCSSEVSESALSVLVLCHSVRLQGSPREHLRSFNGRTRRFVREQKWVRNHFPSVTHRTLLHAYALNDTSTRLQITSEHVELFVRCRTPNCSYLVECRSEAKGRFIDEKVTVLAVNLDLSVHHGSLLLELLVTWLSLR